MHTPAVENWDRRTTFSVCSIEAVGDYIPRPVSGYCALFVRAPDKREALLSLNDASSIFERVRYLLTSENPVKWANPTHVAFEAAPPEDPANHDDLTARRLRLSRLVDDLNPRFKG